MKIITSVFQKDFWLSLTISLLLLLSIISLQSIAPDLFPTYYAYYIAGIICFIIFASLSFEIVKAFSTIGYILSILFLMLPIIFGQVTRGAVRWIQIGSITIQPAELVRPFLLVFFADFVTRKYLNGKRFALAWLLFLIPAFIILMQPSLGVTILTGIGFIGTLIYSSFNKKQFAVLIMIGVLCAPLGYFLLAPYQKTRVQALLTPHSDAAGTGYNSIQSMISVGSGKFFGRGLGRGIQTQLSFLPERHSDFIFASISEEMGFMGATLVLILLFFMLSRVIHIVEHPESIASGAFASGVFLTLLAQTIVHVGMNMRLLPITGLPLPLISAGGSSLLATMILLGMLVSAKKKKT